VILAVAAKPLEHWPLPGRGPAARSRYGRTHRSKLTMEEE
jgi:hypothetical protein